MGRTFEGLVEIELSDFWIWVGQKEGTLDENYVYGVPRINHENQTIEIDFAAGSEDSPEMWAVKPKAITQWEELNKKKPARPVAGWQGEGNLYTQAGIIKCLIDVVKEELVGAATELETPRLENAILLLERVQESSAALYSDIRLFSRSICEYIRNYVGVQGDSFIY